jgi:hypothetical protein
MPNEVYEIMLAYPKSRGIIHRRRISPPTYHPYGLRSGNCTRKTILSKLSIQSSWNSTAKRCSVPSASPSSASRVHPASGRPCRGWCRCSPETSRPPRRSQSQAISQSGSRALCRTPDPSSLVLSSRKAGNKHKVQTSDQLASSDRLYLKMKPQKS